jgi:hypothetical protein
MLPLMIARESEILGLRARAIDAVKHAAVIPHCGTQAVLVPLAICR